MHFKTLFLLTLLMTAQAIDLRSAPPQGAAVPPLRNNETNYTALRQLSLVESFDVADLSIRRDVGNLQLTGKVAFGPEVLGRRALGVFTGTGRFVLEPNVPWEQRNLALHTGDASVSEEFSAAVIWFTDETYAEIIAAGTAGSIDPRASVELQRVRSQIRKGPDESRSGLEALLTGEDMDNVEAVILSDLMNTSRAGAFLAYLHGQRYSDLRYFVRPRGAMPQIMSPEEVALINYDPGSDKEGIWYLAHRQEESVDGRADSAEIKSSFDALHYEMETTIGGGEQIQARTKIRLRAIDSSERVIAFALLPELRVSAVTYRGEGIPFIQEDRRADGSFYVILPEPVAAGVDYELEVAYAGEDVIRSEGGGNFAVGARTSWYPNLGSFNDRATFDLTFHYPKKFELVSVGLLQGEPEKGKDHATARWISNEPLAVAGFNYGAFKKMAVRDEAIAYDIEGYATSTVPSFLQDLSGALPRDSKLQGVVPSRGTTSPKSLTTQVVSEAQASMRIFTRYFGALPYGRVAITQQPAFASGQSWPSLVYLPVSAFLDSTQRWMLLGAGAFNFDYFIDGVTAHEVAHQWWGHRVGWASYRDQWLSEGLAEFSAGLFLQATRREPTDYQKSLEQARQQILTQNEFGYSPNDVGPLSMGHRLSTPRAPRASQLIYSKGSYVIHMLRSMMFDTERGDGPFIEMMTDFVTTHANRNATTESFKTVLEKHVTPPPLMNSISNGTMDWFFDQWVYGTEVPSYEYAYKLTPQEGGKTMLDARIRQTGVSDNFAMPVVLYGEDDGNLFRFASVDLKGSGEPHEVHILLPFEMTRFSINANNDVLAREVKEIPY